MKHRVPKDYEYTYGEKECHDLLKFCDKQLYLHRDTVENAKKLRNKGATHVKLSRGEQVIDFSGKENEKKFGRHEINEFIQDMKDFIEDQHITRNAVLRQMERLGLREKVDKIRSKQMKFTIKKKLFKNALDIVSQALPKETPLIVMKNIKMTYSEEGINLLACNNNTTIDTNIKKEDIKGEGFSALIQGQKIIELVNKLNCEELTLELKENKDIIVTSTTGKYLFRTEGIEAYPNIDSIDFLNSEKKSITLDTKIFKNIVNQALFACSFQNKSRPALVGVNMKNENDYLRITGSDGLRISLNYYQSYYPELFDFNIPTYTISNINVISNILQENSIILHTNESKVIFAFENTTIQTRLIEGKYPLVETFIPQEIYKKISFDRNVILESLSRVLLMSENDVDSAGKNFKKINIGFTNKEVSMSSSGNIGNGKEKISDAIEDFIFEFEINAKYFTEALKSFSSEKITILFPSEEPKFILIRSESYNSNTHDDDNLLTQLIVLPQIGE